MQNTITKRQIDELLEKSEIKVETVYSKVTVVSCKLPNGFVLTESSGALTQQTMMKKSVQKSVWQESKTNCGNLKDMSLQNSFTKERNSNENLYRS